MSRALVILPGRLIFNAFDTTPFDQVRVVILGQDPYHVPGQAHRLSQSTYGAHELLDYRLLNDFFG
ncbi:MAG: hypothetical protein IJS63_10095 [Bacteroidaceae bacterium]|nr:hypothetical protein [Bacteroidaceae bacterium]